jgi:hypothetical protein
MCKGTHVAVVAVLETVWEFLAKLSLVFLWVVEIFDSVVSFEALVTNLTIAVDLLVAHL